MKIEQLILEVRESIFDGKLLDEGSGIKDAVKSVLSDIAFYWKENNQDSELDMDQVYFVLYRDSGIKKETESLIKKSVKLLDQQ